MYIFTDAFKAKRQYVADAFKAKDNLFDNSGENVGDERNV